MPNEETWDETETTEATASEGFPAGYLELLELARATKASIKWDDSANCAVIRVAATIKGENLERLLEYCRLQGITPGQWATETLRQALISPVITSYIRSAKKKRGRSADTEGED